MNIGFIGAGQIANTMAYTMQRMEDVNLYAVAARDLDRAEAFAAQYGFEKAYGSYGEMLLDPNVELVYIATPHPHHAEHMKLCIDSGKHHFLRGVLCIAKDCVIMIAWERHYFIFSCFTLWSIM